MYEPAPLALITTRMNRLEIDWKPTRYRSRHPCWAGGDLVFLPHMSYLICNGMIWCQRLSPFDFQVSADGEVHRINVLSELINKEVIHKKHEIFLRRTQCRLWHKMRIGLMGLSIETDNYWDILTGFHDEQEDTMHPTWSRQLTDCSAFVHSKIRIIQRLFRRRRTPVHMWNIRKIKTFQDVACYFPIDVIKHVTESFVESLASSNVLKQNQHPPMLTIETENGSSRLA